MLNQTFYHGINYLQIQVPPLKFLDLRSKLGINDKEPVSWNGHSDKNIS